MKNNKIRKPILQTFFIIAFPFFLIIWLFNDDSLKEMFEEWGTVLDPIEY